MERHNADRRFYDSSDLSRCSSEEIQFNLGALDQSIMFGSKTYKWLWIIIGVTGTVFFAIIINHGFSPKSTLHTSSHSSQNFEQTNLGLPIRLKIPKINIDAAIGYVGLTSNGEMGVPVGPTSTVWFDLGPRPGENGSAVIAGHDGWKNGMPAVFDDLYQLHTGDKVYVEDKQGTITTFVVRYVETYDQNGDASDVFNPNDGKAHLNLVTCAGTWNATQKSYSNRLVVFTDMETK